ncbi:MAG: Gldg family protein [Bacteroidota bacterium]|nr:Gldg family protein [Bacteroidota bacterium]
MRKIVKIARLEIYTFFYSPIGWLLLSVFMLQCGIFYLQNLQVVRLDISLGQDSDPLTQILYTSNGTGLYSMIKGDLYLYIPILTMGVMSREFSSGSIKLLLSSPVKLHQIILGKYLAVVTYCMMLICILGIYAIIGGIVIVHVDFGLLCVGLLSLSLMVCTYAAIGLFMSSLTIYQVIAAISTLAVFATMQYIGNIGQRINFIRDLSYFLSISGRTEKMTNGLITTKDICYFLIIIVSFLGLGVLRLKMQRELKPWSTKAFRYTALICFTLILGYISSRPGFIGYLDVTTPKSFTLIKSNQEIAKKIDGELKVTTYANLLDPFVFNVLPERRNLDLERLEMYQRFMPGMDISYVYYYNKPTDSSFTDYLYTPSLKGVHDVNKLANSVAYYTSLDIHSFMPPGKMNNLAELKPEGYSLVRKLEYKGKSTFVRFFRGEGDPYAHEPEFMAAVKGLLIPFTNVVFVTGNNERGTTTMKDRDYDLVTTRKYVRIALVNHGFDFSTVDLKTNNIPSDAAILVLADPTIALSTTEQQKIKAYISAGGNMLITGEPGKQQILNPVLKQLGVQLKEGAMIFPDKNITPGFINGALTGEGAALDLKFKNVMNQTVALDGAAAIEGSGTFGFKVTPLLKSMQGGWNKIGQIDPDASFVTDSLQKDIITIPDTITKASSSTIKFDPSAGDDRKVFTVAAALTRKMGSKQQRIIVSGDAAFMSNVELNRSNSRGDQLNYLSGLFGWLSNDVYPVNVSMSQPKDVNLNISKKGITTLMWIFEGIFPALIAIMGLIILYRRRRN